MRKSPVQQSLLQEMTERFWQNYESSIAESDSCVGES
jgi:hypothetical protein